MILTLIHLLIAAALTHPRGDDIMSGAITPACTSLLEWQSLWSSQKMKSTVAECCLMTPTLSYCWNPTWSHGTGQLYKKTLHKSFEVFWTAAVELNQLQSELLNKSLGVKVTFLIFFFLRTFLKHFIHFRRIKDGTPMQRGIIFQINWPPRTSYKRFVQKAVLVFAQPPAGQQGTKQAVCRKWNRGKKIKEMRFSQYQKQTDCFLPRLQMYVGGVWWGQFKYSACA